MDEELIYLMGFVMKRKIFQKGVVYRTEHQSQTMRQRIMSWLKLTCEDP